MGVSRNGNTVSVEHGEASVQFTKRRAFLPDEEALFRSHIAKPNTIRIGMTGFTTLTAEQCAKWGLRLGAYEAACATLLRKLTRHILTQFPGSNVEFYHGSIRRGVDQLVLTTADELNIPTVGFTCIEWASQVDDVDDFPLLITADSRAYSDAFIRHIDILLSTGGRMVALEQDMLAAIKYDKRLVLANVVRALSSNGSPAARNERGEIENAASAFEQAIYMQSLSSRAQGVDQFGELQRYVAEAVTHIGRQLLDPSVAFAE